jgi:phytoene synthase
LLSAFKQDVMKSRYEDFPTVLDYCRRSANPIGRLVLLLHGERATAQLEASDAICTALQLANFWQDVSVDLLKDRIYLPQDELRASGVTEASLFAGLSSAAWRELLQKQVERTETLFQQGYALIPTLPQPLKTEILFTWQGGRLILRKIQEQGFDTLRLRPKISKLDLPILLLQVLASLR